MSLCVTRRAALLVGLVIVLALVAGCTPAPAAPAEATAVPEQPTAVAEPTAVVEEPTAVAEPPTPEPTAVVETGASGDNVIGKWEGVTNVAGQELITRFALEAEGDGLKGTVDFPQQNANGIPLDVVTFEDGKLHIEVMPAPRTAVFEGALDGRDKLTGMFSQAGYDGTFEMTRVDAAAETLPYVAEEVEFQNGDVTLAGTLTLPEGDGPVPAVVLITGSGASNRDEEIFGFKIFGVLADHLTRQGIAVLRYDDRGIGGSGGGGMEETSETFAGDVAAAAAYLKGRSEIAADKIGLLGHSEGGIIAPMVATGGVEDLSVQPDDIAFVVLMAGSALPGSDILIMQGEAIAQAGGADAEAIAKQTAMQERAIEAALSGEGWDEIEAELRQEFQAAAEGFTEEQRQAVGDVDEWVEQMVASQTQAMQSGWMKFFLGYDPAPALEKLAQPVLAVFGEKDLQVSAEANSKAAEEAFERGTNEDTEIVVIPGANHLFQLAVTGSPDEYPNLDADFAPGFLSAVSDWILAHTK